MRMLVSTKVLAVIAFFTADSSTAPEVEAAVDQGERGRTLSLYIFPRH
jgi:hypothetical protein